MARRMLPTIPGFFELERAKVDLVSNDRRLALKVENELSSGRAFYFALLQTALYLNKHPTLERACLILIRPQLSEARLRKEWKELTEVLGPQVTDRMRLLVVGTERSWCLPSDPQIQALSISLDSSKAEERHSGLRSFRSRRPGMKDYEVWKVMLNRWLLKQGPIAIGELAANVGCSYPTVRQALARPALRKRLNYRSNRSAELTAFPHDAWDEICVLGQSARLAYRFQDASGDLTSPLQLMQRLEKLRPGGAAVGGVLAARYWDPDLDLHGTPRLDVVLHAPAARVDLGFVMRLDPALELIEDTSQSALLVVQPLFRAKSLFADNPSGQLPFADPVETALGLLDLELVAQANHLLTALRPEARLI